MPEIIHASRHVFSAWESWKGRGYRIRRHSTLLNERSLVCVFLNLPFPTQCCCHTVTKGQREALMNLLHTISALSELDLEG